jgi:hypothetical protein
MESTTDKVNLLQKKEVKEWHGVYVDSMQTCVTKVIL